MSYCCVFGYVELLFQGWLSTNLYACTQIDACSIGHDILPVSLYFVLYHMTNIHA